MKETKRHTVSAGPIFVVGAPRSGTTLLQSMLRSHPNISSPTGESNFFVKLYRHRGAFGDLSKLDNIRRVLLRMHEINPQFLETDFHGLEFQIERLAKDLHQQGRDSVPGILAGLYETNMRGEGKARWLEKTPSHVFHLETIFEMFPDAQFVHIIRDGRDAALSMLRRKHDLKVYNVLEAAWQWRRFVECGQRWGRQINVPVYFEIHYENLLGQPVDTMKSLLAFLGESYTDAVIDYQKSRDPASKTPLLSGPLRAENTGKWRREMTSWNIRVFESVADDTLARNGYLVRTQRNSLPRLVPWAYRKHNAVACWLNAKRRELHARP